MGSNWTRWATVALLVGLLSLRASANFVVIAESAPIGRLITNVGTYVKAHPDDARATYTLGRLHSLAYAHESERAEVTVALTASRKGQPLDLPRFPAYDSVRVRREDPEAGMGAGTRWHLVESIRLYRRALKLDAKNALYLLGCAWMVEQGASRAGALGILPGTKGARTPESWRAEALALYREAYAIEMPKHLKAKDWDTNEGDHMIGIEAGEGVLRLLGTKPSSEADRDEADRITREIKEVKAKPGWITPILVSLRPDARLADLLAPGRVVSFDLAATGSPQRWPWVRPDTGILVWDPERKGRIASGGRLFGSRTWQMFWRSGYEALAALDDNRDGSLAGKELAGIAVWFDRNGNGRSDPGEVVPVADLGIVRLAASASGETDGVPANPRGIELRDGTACPTYDWTPRSVK